MNKPHLLIGEAADWLGVTEKALRHYEEIGLISPERGPNGYRLYAADHLLRIERIRRLQDLGLSLRQIQRILDEEGDEGQWRELLHALLDDIDAQMDVLEERRARVERLLDEGVPVEAVELPSTLVDAQMQLGGISAGRLQAERRFHAMVDRVEQAGLVIAFDPTHVQQRLLPDVLELSIGYQLSAISFIERNHTT